MTRAQRRHFMRRQTQDRIDHFVGMFIVTMVIVLAWRMCL
jgi:hypothetical protein